jgi:hypothetical protein
MQLCVSNCVEIENGVMAYCVIRRRENGLKNFKIRIISDEDEIRKRQTELSRACAPRQNAASTIPQWHLAQAVMSLPPEQ